MGERYVDPNSGAAPQPGGFAGAPPVLADGEFDAAVADELTDEQEQAAEAEEKVDRKPVRGAHVSKKATGRRH